MIRSNQFILILCLLFRVVVSAQGQLLQQQNPTSSPQQSDPTQEVLPPTFTLEFEPGPYEIGESVPFAIIPMDGNPVGSLKVKVGREQANMLKISQQPTTQDGITWSGEFVALTDVVTSVEPFTVTGKAPDGTQIKGTSTSAPIQMILLPEEPKPQDYSYADPLKPEVEYRGIIMAAILGFVLFLLIVAVIILVVYLLLKRKNAELQNGIKSLSPIEELENQFSLLQKGEHLAEQGIEYHYTKLSFAVRQYLERTGTMRALEMTDNELEDLARYANQDSSLKVICGLFDQCSAAKYAQSRYTEQVIQNDLESLLRFIQSEKKRIAREEEIRLEQQRNSSRQKAAA